MSIYKYESKDYVASYYSTTIQAKLRQEFPQLIDQHEFDIVVIGGGFTGLSTALELGKMGHKVALVERRRICWGASGRNGGHILVNYNRGMAHIEGQIGKVAAKTLFEFSRDARELLYQRINEYQIDCDLKRGTASLVDKQSQVSGLQDDLEYMEKNYQYPLEYWDKDRVQQEIQSPLYLGGLFDKNNAHFHPLNFGLGLAKVAREKYGVQIFEQSGVNKWQKLSRHSSPSGSSGKQGVGKFELLFDKGKIEARQLVFACNAYIDGLVPYLHRRVMLIGSFINTTAPLLELAGNKRLIKSDIAVSDHNNEVTYFRLSPDNRLIFGGGESFFANAQSDKLRARGREMMQRVFPQLKDIKIDYSWGGHLASTVNRLPHIGRLNKNVYYAQGFAGHGVSLTGQVGKMLAETVHADLSGSSPSPVNGRSASPTISEIFQSFRHAPMPMTEWFRRPALALAMYYYRFIDTLGR